MAEEYTKVVEFPDQSPSFAYGFECGQIWALMKERVPRIRQTINDEHADFIAAMAERQGYRAAFNALSD